MVKNQNFSNHLYHLQLMFDLLHQHQVKLNPAKCKFGVRSCVFLGHVISEKGIKAHSNLIKAVRSLSKPKSKKDVQVLSRKVAALSRFISIMTDRCGPFFRALQGGKSNIVCGDFQRKAFRDLKEFLLTLPVLDFPRAKETLFLYLAVSDVASSSVLF